MGYEQQEGYLAGAHQVEGYPLKWWLWEGDYLVRLPPPLHFLFWIDDIPLAGHTPSCLIPRGSCLMPRGSCLIGVI